MSMVEGLRRVPVRHVVMPGHVLKVVEPQARDTVALFVERNDWSFKLPTICIVNGQPVLRKDWAVCEIKATDEVTFLSRPHGGGRGTGKSILGLVGVIALAAFAPWAGAALFGAGTLLAGAASVAIAIGGGLLLNALVKPKAGGQNAAQTEATAGQVYSVGASGNVARLLQPISTGYGRVKEQPDFAATPWSEYEGNEQFLNLLFSIGTGKYHPHQVFIDDTIMWDETTGLSASYPGAQLQFYGPGEQITMFPANVIQSIEVSGQSLAPDVFVGGFIANPAGTVTKRLALDFVFPSGIFHVNSEDGKLEPRTVAMEVQVRTVNNSGVPTSAFLTVATPTYTGASRTPQRHSVNLNLGEYRYEVRVRRTTAAGGDNDSDDVAWTGLRAYFDGDNSKPGVTTLAIRIKASAQLSEQSARKFGVLRTRILPVWDTGSQTFVEQATRSAFWAAYDIAINTDYGAKRPASKVDFQTLFTMALAFPDAHFDYTFNSSVLVPEALDIALRPALSRHRWAGDVLTFVRDEWVDTRQMLVTDREIVRGSLRIDFDMNTEDSADAVVFEYLEEQTWRPDEVQYPPDTDMPYFRPENPARIQMDGVVERDAAFELAARMYLQSVYRRTKVTFDTEHDGRMLSYGAKFFLQTELPTTWGYSGEVMSLSAGVVTVSPAPKWAVSGQHYVTVRDKRGRPFGPIKCSKGTGDDKLVIDAVDLAQVESDLGRTLVQALARADDMEPPSFSFGLGEARERPCMVVSGRPSGDRVTIIAVVDDERVHEDDLGNIPPSPTVPALTDDVAPQILGLYASFRQGIAEPILDASWWPAAGARYYVAEISYDGGSSYTPIYEGSGTSLSVVVDRADARLRVRGIGNRAGTWTTIDVEVPEIRIAPNTVAPESLIKGLQDYVKEILPQTLRSIDFINQRIARNASEQDAANETYLRNTRTLVASQNVKIEETAEIIEDQVTGKFAGLWMVTVNVNGYVSGISSYNDGSTSDFAIIADNFFVAKPGVLGGAPVPVFTVSTVNGVTKVAFRGDMYADGSINATSLNVTTLSAISANLGTVTAGVARSLDGRLIIDFTNARITISDTPVA